MTEQRSPDEEPIIELTEIVEPSAASDDEIIELTEVVDNVPTADEDVIELTDVVDNVTPADEDVIELTDVVEKAPPVDEEVIELTDVVENASPADEAAIEPAEEDIPDLVDMVEEAPAEASSAPELTAAPEEMTTEPEDFPEEDMPGMAASAGAAFDLFADTEPEETDAPAVDAADPNDDLDFAPMDLDIEENKEDDLFDSLGMNLEPELQGSASSDELDFNLSTQELSDAIDLLDAKLAEEPPLDGSGEAAQTAALPATVSEAQLENALENVIRKMFAEKIDILINEAIEKTVSAEIENLKNQLLQDSTEE